jgi:outer membrane immunogenic protein
MRVLVKFFLGVSAISLAGASTAFAADMAVKAPRMAVAADPWTGWYVGLHAGGAQERSCNDYTPQAVVDPFNNNFLASLDVGCSTSTGFIGGGQIGANQQVGRWVFGLEADISGLTTKTSRNTAGISGLGALFTANQTVKLNALATVGPRVGALVTDNTLLYVTGGLAMADVNAYGGELGPAGPPQFQGFGSVSKWTPGWTVGAGVETKINGGPWSVKAEYVYAKLNAVHYDTQQPQVNVGTGFDNIGESIGASTELQIVRVGVNYKIGAPAAGAYAAMGTPTYNWTGAYFGANVGGVWGRSHAQEPNQEAEPGAGAFNAFGDAFTASTTGTTGGAQIGYNWQASSIVYGLEGDFGYLGFKGQQSSNLFAGTFVSSTGGAFGTFRGRIGYAADRALFYVTGGLIVADVAAGVSNPFNTGPNFTDGIIFTSKTNAEAGWTAGGGIEYALGRGWSVKGEYLHFDLGTKRVSGRCENCFAPNLYAWDIRNSGDLVRFGVNYQLGMGPIVARY